MDETRLTTLLADLAGADAPATTMSVAKAVTDGRRHIGHRRLAAAIAAAVALITLGAAGLYAKTAPPRPPDANPTGAAPSMSPTQPTSPTASPSPTQPTSPTQSTGVTHPKGLLWYYGWAVRNLDGSLFTNLQPPGGVPGFFDQVFKVPSGWLFELTYGTGIGTIWFEPNRGPAVQLIGGNFGRYTVSADGSTVVADKILSMSDSPLRHRVVAYNLPSLHLIRETTTGVTAPPTSDLMIQGDKVLVMKSSRPAIWNLTTGAITLITGDGIAATQYGFTAKGDILGSVHALAPGGQSICLAVTSPVTGLITHDDRDCFPDPGGLLGGAGWLSPNGATLVLSQSYGMVAMTMTGRRPGAWDTQTLTGSAGLVIDFWLSNTKFVARGGDKGTEVSICDTSTRRCTRFTQVHTASAGIVDVLDGG